MMAENPEKQPKSKELSEKSLKSQISNILNNDKKFLQKIADAVSECIVQKVLNSKDFLNKIADHLTKSDDLVQKIYTGLSFDIDEAKDRYSKLEQEHAGLADANKQLQQTIDNLEQYGRRNCLLLHGIPEPINSEESAVKKSNEDTDKIAIDILNSKLGININKQDIDRSHRLGRSGKRGKPRPIIIKFVAYNKRSEVFRSKKQLKGTGITITESLTQKKQELLQTAKMNQKVKSVWTLDGRIICLLYDDKTKVVIETADDLGSLK